MAKRKANRLTDKFCQTAPDGEHTDGGGLVLRVGNGGSQKSWQVRVKIDGKVRKPGLGGYPAVSLADARLKAKRKIAELKGERLPVEVWTRHLENPDSPMVGDGATRLAADIARLKSETQPSTGPTFRDMAIQAIEFWQVNWSSKRYSDQWPETFTKYVYPHIGDKPIDEITSADILAVLRPIWTNKGATAANVKQRMERVFDWAIAHGNRTDNPAAAVSAALGRQSTEVKHHAALPYGDVAAALVKVRESTAEPLTQLAFELLALTATRSNEVRGATWGEIDFDGRLWTIPAERMKARRPHEIPLSGQAIDVLQKARELSDGDGLIFPNERTGKILGRGVFQKLIQRLELPCTAHGFRSSFKDWCIETGKDWAISETALAHKLGDTVQSAYARTTLIERRRELMEQWAVFISGDVADTD